MIGRVAIAVVLTALSSSVALAVQGHQITPQIVDYVVAETDLQQTSGKFGETGVPTVVEVGGAYMVAFRGFKWPSSNHGIYSWDTAMTSPLLAFQKTDLVSSIELPTGSFSGAITAIDGGVPPAISTNGSIAQLVTLSGIPSPGQGVVRQDPFGRISSRATRANRSTVLATFSTRSHVPCRSTRSERSGSNAL